ncbi:hypothetical protein EC919_103232 [Pseudomonas graminis]|nr:hypothetical protein EC919_103232 [Pseudomonas graminis]
MRREGAFGDVHDDRVFNAGDKIAHLLKVDSAIFSPPLYLLCPHYLKQRSGKRRRPANQTSAQWMSFQNSRLSR